MYKTFPVIPPLQPFVACIWNIQAEAKSFTAPERLVPDGNIELLLNCGESVSLTWPGDKKEHHAYQGSYVVGQRSLPCFTTATGRVNLIGVSFRPGGFSPFLDRPVSDVTDATVPLSLLPSGPFSCLEESVLECPGIEQKVSRLQHLLVRRLSARSGRTEKAGRFLPLLYTLHRYGSVAQFLKEHTIHERTLQRMFDEYVGLSPKYLQRVLRFKAAVTALHTARPKNLTALAYDAGYFDQAHFINEFKALAGVAPGQYVKECGTLSAVWTEE